MSYHFSSLTAGLLAALMALQGCAGDDQTGARDPEPSPPPAATAAREVVTATQPDGVSAVAVPADESTAVDATEAEHAARRAAAQSYLDRARADAEERHRLALAHCQGSVVLDIETCVATADGSLEAEMRSARVEFDAQMEGL